MAWARPAGAPELPACPLDALEPKENDYKPLFSNYGLPIAAAILGFLGPGVANYYSRRPLYAGIWKFPVFGLVGGYIGLKIFEIREDMYNDKDEVLRQYIKLHPEDFPNYKRVLIKDTIQPWNPRR